MIDKKERSILLIILIVITLWFTVGISYFYNISSNNSSLFYFLFLISYTLLINKFILNETFNFKNFFSLFLIIMVSSIWLPPYLITINDIPDLSQNLKYAGDVLIYGLLPLTWNHAIKYYLTYIIFPVLLLGTLAYINNRSKFLSLLKNGA